MNHLIIEQVSGVGIHSRYAIRQGSKLIATMDRGSSYRRPWSLYSAHYHEHLGGVSKNIEYAKQYAASFNYPSATEVYEKICVRIEQQRRHWKQEQCFNRFTELARDLANGSNSAQQALIDLHNAIEAFAKDRSVTEKPLDPDRPEGTFYTSGEPIYPKPPATEG